MRRRAANLAQLRSDLVATTTRSQFVELPRKNFLLQLQPDRRGSANQHRTVRQPARRARSQALGRLAATRARNCTPCHRRANFPVTALTLVSTRLELVPNLPF